MQDLFNIFDSSKLPHVATEDLFQFSRFSKVQTEFVSETFNHLFYYSLFSFIGTLSGFYFSTFLVFIGLVASCIFVVKKFFDNHSFPNYVGNLFAFFVGLFMTSSLTRDILPVDIIIKAFGITAVIFFLLLKLASVDFNNRITFYVSTLLFAITVYFVIESISSFFYLFRGRRMGFSLNFYLIITIVSEMCHVFLRIQKWTYLIESGFDISPQLAAFDFFLSFINILKNVIVILMRAEHEKRNKEEENDRKKRK
eukprot:TRINITY_DN2244_c0_g1_i1.p1 TRINITY_DN2244_c0_g1~~TRINITY_DN2244_c0_g1_i1.p1  ORF type:complete len:254 (-),score=55.66 TRINITY_DN2244_c0_g1_i1:28-789(-)